MFAHSGQKQWRSRTAVLRRVSSGDGEVILKMAHGWSARDAEAVAALHQSWGALLEAVPRVTCPPAIPTQNPPGVIMPWINGHSVSALLVAGKETAEIVHRAGRALALLHDELRDAEPSAAFRSVRRKLLLPPGPVGAVRAVRSVVDFTPYNMLVDDSGILSIIDVEPVRPSVSLHSDLAWFLGWYGEYGGKEPEAFLSGYERQTGRAFDRDDERLLATFLTRFHAFRARVQLRRRNWSAAAEAFAAGRREWSRAL